MAMAVKMVKIIGLLRILGGILGEKMGLGRFINPIKRMKEPVEFNKMSFIRWLVISLINFIFKIYYFIKGNSESL